MLYSMEIKNKKKKATIQSLIVKLHQTKLLLFYPHTGYGIQWGRAGSRATVAYNIFKKFFI